MTKLIRTIMVKSPKATRLYKAKHPSINAEFNKYVITGRVKVLELEPTDDLWDSEEDKLYYRVILSKQVWEDVSYKEKFNDWLRDNGHLEAQKKYNQANGIIRKVIEEIYEDD